MRQPLCTRAGARARANAHARRSESFHGLETLLAQRRFQLIPMEILLHCAAVPLGVMVRGIMESLLDAEALGKLLQEYAPQQYTLELAMDALVSLLIQVSAGHRASVFAAYTADQASMRPTISTSYQALYGKLGRMDPELSEAIVRFCAEKLRPVLEKLPLLMGDAAGEVNVNDRIGFGGDRRVILEVGSRLDPEQIGQGQSPQSDRPDRQEAAAADRLMEASWHLEGS